MKFSQSRLFRTMLHIGVDLLITSFTFLIIYWEAVVGHNYTTSELIPTIIFYISGVTFKMITYYLFGFYDMITVYFGIVDAVRVGVISAATTLLLYIVEPFLTDVLSWSPIEFLLLVMAESFLLITSRLFKRIATLYLVRSERLKNSKRTLIIGAGAAGKIVIDEFRSNYNLTNYVVGFVDDDPEKINSTFSGLKVLGPISNISSFIKALDVSEVVIAIANISRQRLFEIIRLMEHDNVKIKRLPLMEDLQGENFKNKILDVDINELLGRDVVGLESDEIRTFIHDKVVLITGAGGSIGSELARQIFKSLPKKLVLLDLYENTVYDLQQELRALKRKTLYQDIIIDVVIASTYNRERLDEVFSTHRPHLVFHAAAYKHVPLMEEAPQEAIRTNIMGTEYVCALAERYQVQKVVFVSTDKAVRPTNIMGATKAYAELVLKAHQTQSKGTVFSAVRFGNVLGSNGSVIPLFKKQIEAGGPVTLTHKEMTRYFMTIPEAVGLILQCGVYARGGEIFILDMGTPVRILDLAEKMIRQAGYVPHKEIVIEEIGLRPGEKLYEEILVDPSQSIKTQNQKIYIEKQNTTKDGIVAIPEVEKLLTAKAETIRTFFKNKGILTENGRP